MAKLLTILDREAKITHEQFASQIELRIGTGDGDDAKGPDMKVWSQGRGLQDVRFYQRADVQVAHALPFRWSGDRPSFVTLPSSSRDQPVLGMT